MPTETINVELIKKMIAAIKAKPQMFDMNYEFAFLKNNCRWPFNPQSVSLENLLQIEKEQECGAHCCMVGWANLCSTSVPISKSALESRTNAYVALNIDNEYFSQIGYDSNDAWEYWEKVGIVKNYCFELITPEDGISVLEHLLNEELPFFDLETNTFRVMTHDEIALR